MYILHKFECWHSYLVFAYRERSSLKLQLYAYLCFTLLNLSVTFHWNISALAKAAMKCVRVSDLGMNNYKWMHAWMNELTKELTNEWMNERKNKRID